MSEKRPDPNMEWLYHRDEEEGTAVLPPGAEAPSSGAAAPRSIGPRSTGPIFEPTPARRPPSSSSTGYPAVPAGGYPQQPRQGSVTPPPRSPAPPATATPPPRPRKKPRRSVLRTLGYLILAWLLFMVGTPAYAIFSTSRVEATSSGTPLPNQPGTTVLLVGSDAREDLTDEQRRELGTGSTEGRRTDTMMLLHRPVQGQPVLLSLPRDSLVEIPGHGRNRLNAAFAFGGAPLLVETIEASTGIQIDGYLEIGFVGIVDLIDAVGGIEVCPENPIQDRDSHLDIPAGCQMLDGVTGLGYVRMRKADPRGDLGRMERQREVIKEITTRALRPATLLNPVRYWRLNMAAANTLRRGDNTSIVEMGATALGFVAVTRGAGLSLTVPVADANYHADGVGSTILWDDDAAQRVFDAIASGDTRSLE
ncbi:MAG TPA: LCP family protein [Arachnia sp.]|nr:LCP family protein [Arachnia sp.]